MNLYENYNAISPGNYHCNPIMVIKMGNNIKGKLVFYVNYKEHGLSKMITVEYIFTEKSRIMTYGEIMALLHNAGIQVEDEARLFYDLDSLAHICQTAFCGKHMVLKVVNKQRQGKNFKELRLYNLKPRNR